MNCRKRHSDRANHQGVKEQADEQSPERVPESPGPPWSGAHLGKRYSFRQALQDGWQKSRHVRGTDALQQPCMRQNNYQLSGSPATVCEMDDITTLEGPTQHVTTKHYNISWRAS